MWDKRKNDFRKYFLLFFFYLRIISEMREFKYLMKIDLNFKDETDGNYILIIIFNEP